MYPRWPPNFFLSSLLPDISSWLMRGPGFLVRNQKLKHNTLTAHSEEVAIFYNWFRRRVENMGVLNLRYTSVHLFSVIDSWEITYDPIMRVFFYSSHFSLSFQLRWHDAGGGEAVDWEEQCLSSAYWFPLYDGLYTDLSSYYSIQRNRERYLSTKIKHRLSICLFNGVVSHYWSFAKWDFNKYL